MEEKYSTVKELTDALEGSISVTALARICGVNGSLMRQYALGMLKPGPKVMARINKGLAEFGKRVQLMRLDPQLEENNELFDI